MMLDYSPLLRAIADLISPPPDERWMRYRLFQVLYWMHRGGAIDAAFIEASQIYLLIEFGRTAQKERTRSLRSTIQFAFNDNFVKSLLDGAGTSVSFYQNLFADPKILSPKKLIEASGDFDRLHRMNLLKLWSSNISYNFAFQVGHFPFKRSTGQSLRDKYGCASYFVSAAIFVDKKFLPFISREQVADLKLPGAFDKMVREMSTDRSRILQFLAISKHITQKLDLETAQLLHAAWPELEPVQCHIPTFSDVELSRLTPTVRRTSTERSSTRRQVVER